MGATGRSSRVAVRGKAFALDGSPFRLRAARCRAIPGELRAIAAAGYTALSIPPPPEPEIERAVASGLRVVLELDDPALHDLAASSKRGRRRVAWEVAMRLRRAVRPWRGGDALLGVALGGRIDSRSANELALGLHEEDPGLLAGWRGAPPLGGECPAEFDFLLLECEPPDGRRLMAAHAAVGDRPLVLGSAAPPARSWADLALRCGAAGTIAPHRPEADQDEIAAANRRTVADLDVDWPSISVVINAYNAAETIGECLSHCERLDYPRLEVIVVDDGSTDATPEIVARHRGARLITIPHGGLSIGRNVGYREAAGELVAYLDADAYPSPDWPWYLALAASGERVGGSGGPNVPPPDDPGSARVVARSPGGPVPQLSGPDRAAHLPGCNMAFRRQVLEQLGGFDSAFDAAADDLELGWRVAEAGYEIAYHPAALVWHHRRPGLGRYLRQQRQYGRSQAILEDRHPERFPAGHRVRRLASRLRASGDAPAPYRERYVTLGGQDDAAVEVAHQWGVPAAAALCLTAPLGLVRRRLALGALAGASFAAVLFAIDFAAAGEGQRRAERAPGFRARVACFRLLRPLAFRWGHLRTRYELRRAGSRAS